MIGRHIVLGLVVAAAVAADVRADMTSPPWCESRHYSGGTAQASPTQAADPLADFGLGIARLRDVPLGELAADSNPPPAQDVKQLPPAPDSASLFLSALGTLGALQVGRAMRKGQWGLLPDWYHGGGPGQVGHAFATDLNPVVALPPCDLDRPAGERPSFYSIQHDWLPRWQPQRSLPTAAPRGPPLLS